MTWTHSAVPASELDLDHLILDPVERWRPTHTGLSFRAGRLLLRPIDRKVAGCEARPLFRLPMVVAAGRAKQLNVIFLRTGNKEFRVDVPGMAICNLGTSLCPANAA